MNYRGTSLVDLMNRSDAKLAVVFDELLSTKIVPIQRRLGNISVLVVAHRLEKQALYNADAIESWKVFELGELNACSKRAPEVQVINSDPSCIVFTSGTTGSPKAVVNAHEFWIHSCDCKIEHMGTSSEDIIYNCFPMYNPTGQVETSLCALMADAKVAMASEFNPKEFWNDIRKYGCTETVSMGGAFALVEKNPPSEDDRNHPLKKVYIIPLPEDFQRRCEERFGIRMMEFYGQTEAGLVCFRTWDRGKPGSCGFSNSGYEIRIFDENDDDCPPNVAGEIVVRPMKSHTIAREYYKDPERFSVRMKNCWWHTGDLGRMDEDGYLYFLRRKEETIRFRGYFVSTTEVERILSQHPNIVECAVYPVPDAMGQEQDVMAAVRLRDGVDISPEEILRHCERDLPFYMIPCYLRFVREFNKTPTMRIIKEGLKQEGVTEDTWSRRKANFKLARD